MALANAGWMMSGRVVSDALSLAIFAVVAREYGPGGVGIYSACFAVATVLFDIVSLGIGDYGVREYARAAPAQRPALLRRLYTLQAAMAFVCMLVLGTAAVFLPITSNTTLILLFLTVFQVSNALAATFFIPSLVAGSMNRWVMATVASRVGVAMVAVLVALMRDGALQLALLGFPVFGLAALTYGAITTRQQFSAGGVFASLDSSGNLLKQLLPFAFASALTNLIVRVPMFVLIVLVGDAAAGLYATAFKLTEVGWMLLTFVPVAAYATLVRVAGTNPKQMPTVSDRVLRLTLVIGGLIAWGLAVLGPPLLLVALGDKVAGAVPLLAIMSIFVLIQAVSRYLLQMMLVFDRQASRLWITVLQALFTVVLCVPLTMRFNLAGATVTLLLSESVALVAYAVRLRSELPLAPLCRRVAQFVSVVVLAITARWLSVNSGLMPAIADGGALAVFLAGSFATGLLSKDLWEGHQSQRNSGC
jgi:O-antigen/teichoic acid export membrane protein